MLLCGSAHYSLLPDLQVIQYGKGGNITTFEDFKRMALIQLEELRNGNPAVLFVLIADECHWGPTVGGEHDRFVNDPELIEAANVLTLLVSATPYNVLTRNSRIDQTRDSDNEGSDRGNVIRWFTHGEPSEYRSSASHWIRATKHAMAPATLTHPTQSRDHSSLQWTFI